jgi:ureidoglycolate lyase|tara:strand:- start:167 stop:1006 length:840 start_codon:yes stop_codon:yes gene_type:complete
MMKLLRVGTKGHERPAILDLNENIRDLSSLLDDITGATLSDEVLSKIRAIDLSTLPILSADSRIGPCVGNVGKFICIGLNYSDHAKESGMEIPSEPVIFMKATSAINGPNDNIEIPPNSEKSDWEVELGLVIGKEAKYINEADAMQHIAGFCVINDLSERHYQLECEGQWVKGKSCDTYGPIGPWMVTRDEISDMGNLPMWLEVNGHRYQQGNTDTMVFKPAYIVSYLSQFMSLQPGDIISTGTPPGVGFGQRPEVYLKRGDKITLGIEGLGEQHQICV